MRTGRPPLLVCGWTSRMVAEHTGIRMNSATRRLRAFAYDNDPFRLLLHASIVLAERSLRCSKTNRLNRRRPASATCLSCGRPFDPKRSSNAKRLYTVTCSQKCRGDAMRSGKLPTRAKVFRSCATCGATCHGLHSGVVNCTECRRPTHPERSAVEVDGLRVSVSSMQIMGISRAAAKQRIKRFNDGNLSVRCLLAPPRKGPLHV